MRYKSLTPPPWEVVDLIIGGQHLDPKDLATACCVCKSWSISMSSDHLWQAICTTTYPSLSSLGTFIPYIKVYSLGRAAEKRRLQSPPKPQLSMADLVFAIDIERNGDRIATVVKGLEAERNGIFRFDIDVVNSKRVAVAALDSLRITWNVVLEGFKGVFTVMDCRGKGSFVLGLEGWFSKELPSPGCCSSGGASSGLVADLRLGLREEEISKEEVVVVVEKMSVGLLSVVSWRYVFVDDALRYLQHFLLPSDQSHKM